MEKLVLAKLQEKFDDQDTIEFIDYKGDGRHYFLRIISDKFNEKSRIERSRAVFEILGEMIEKEQIHALQMELKTPAEINN